MPFDFSGKKVLVTGAGKGIGRGVAIALSKSSCKVYALSRTQSDLDTLAAECPGIVTILADLCNWENTREKLDQLETLDGLVNNAGIVGHDYAAVDCPEDYIHKVLNNNLLSAINCTQVIAKKMVEAKVKGSIVNVSSIGSLGSIPNGLPYNVSKAGMDMATKQFALELGPHEIRVNFVNPGMVITPLAQRFLDEGILTEKILTCRSPMGRSVRMQECVDPILYLLSEHSSIVTGQLHVLDGGIMSNITIKVQ